MALNLPRLLLLSVVSAMCSWALGCGPQEPSEVPDELIGVWMTAAPGWEDRFLKLEKRAIHFGIGGDQAMVGPVIGVETEPFQGATLYRIKYLSPDGGEFTKPIYYDAKEDELRYRNRPNLIWKRVDIDIDPADPDIVSGAFMLPFWSGRYVDDSPLESFAA